MFIGISEYYKGVSVIVPVYNAEKMIGECISSLLNLNYDKKLIELIIVNNNSTDKTTEILNKYKDSITILEEPKKGPAAARNRGIVNAKFNKIAFTDADCIVDKDWIYNLIGPLNAINVGLVGGRILSKSPANKIEKYGEEIHNHEKAINKYIPPYAVTMNWASRTSVLREMGFFNENLIRGEDNDLSRRIYRAGYKLVYCPEAVIFHQNRTTLGALFYQGYLHGYYGVNLNKIHLEYLNRIGYRRVNLNTYMDLYRNVRNYIKNKNDVDSMCNFIFNSGKKIGKIHGSVRFMHFEI